MSQLSSVVRVQRTAASFSVLHTISQRHSQAASVQSAVAMYPKGEFPGALRLSASLQAGSGAWKETGARKDSPSYAATRIKVAMGKKISGE